MISNAPDKDSLICCYLSGKNHSQISGFQYLFWDDLVGMVKSPLKGIVDKNKLPFIAPHSAKSKKKSDALAYDAYTLLIADIDEGNLKLNDVVARLKFKKIESFVVYSTFSHNLAKGNNPPESRWRVLIELGAPVSASYWQKLQMCLCSYLGGDSCAVRLQQIAYLPAHGTGGYEYYIQHGIAVEELDFIHPLIEDADSYVEHLEEGLGEEITTEVVINPLSTLGSDFEFIKNAAKNHWSEILPALGVGEGYLVDSHGPCPGCGGQDRFRFDNNGFGTWICSQGGKGIVAGDGFFLLAHCGLYDLNQSLLDVVAEYLISKKFVNPINMYEQIVEKALLSMEDDRQDSGAIFEARTLEALRFIRENDVAVFSRIRTRVKNSRLVSMAIFDKEINVQSEENISQDKIFSPVVPWHNPVNGEELLDSIANIIRQYVIANNYTIDAATLWVMFTWFIDVVGVAPIANITAPEKRCGKTVLLSVMAKLAFKPLAVSNIAPVALFRAMDRWGPTLLIDEVDSFLSEHEEARGILNAGFTRESAFVVRCAGDNHEPTPFSVWGAKALCGIGKIADTLSDRSIPLKLRRKLVGEKTVKLRHGKDNELFERLRSKIARFAEDSKVSIASAVPEEIDGLNDRANDCWEPLLAIAEEAGGVWPARARGAAIALHGMEEFTPSIEARLLQDIKIIFEDKGVSKIHSRELLALLTSDDEAPWATWNGGYQLSLKQLADMLKAYSICSKQLRIGGLSGRKGYKKTQFQDAWDHYLQEESL